MAKHICPAWVGYFLLNPLRRLFEDPDKMLSDFVRERMVVLEPGPGMGYFTLPMARSVGPKGKVVAIDVQQEMISALARRAREAGLQDRIDCRLAERGRLGVTDLTGEVDFVPLLYMLHEVPDRRRFLDEIRGTLKSGGKLLIIEPKFHVRKRRFGEILEDAVTVGFVEDRLFSNFAVRGAVFINPPS